MIAYEPLSSMSHPSVSCCCLSMAIEACTRAMNRSLHVKSWPNYPLEARHAKVSSAISSCACFLATASASANCVTTTTDPTLSVILAQILLDGVALMLKYFVRNENKKNIPSQSICRAVVLKLTPADTRPYRGPELRPSNGIAADFAMKP
jgi:hypothetical protein